MSERERLSEEAYERKKEYNREYRRLYMNKNKLVTFGADIEANKAREITNLLAKKQMTRKDFVLWAYEELKKTN